MPADGVFLLNDSALGLLVMHERIDHHAHEHGAQDWGCQSAMVMVMIVGCEGDKSLTPDRPPYQTQCKTVFPF
jgi:hypothetical protein